jgi:hypothetical protein
MQFPTTGNRARQTKPNLAEPIKIYPLVMSRSVKKYTGKNPWSSCRDILPLPRLLLDSSFVVFDSSNSVGYFPTFSRDSLFLDEEEMASRDVWQYW